MYTMAINKPMLAATLNDEVINFPVLVTPKIDGIRALKLNGALVSRTLKLIPNCHVRRLLEPLLPEGADGEITCGDAFYETTSAVMSYNREVNECKLRFYWFDWVSDAAALSLPYTERVRMIQQYTCTAFITPLIPYVILNQRMLDEFESNTLSQGHEGVMLRKPDGKYKCGRSTLSEGLLLKLKRFQDAEATIVGVEELIHKDKTRGDTLGSLIVATEGITFKIGTGFTNEIRMCLWAARHNILGQRVKYKHMNYGSKVAPRSSVFIGIRHIDDV